MWWKCTTLQIVGAMINVRQIAYQNGRVKKKVHFNFNAHQGHLPSIDFYQSKTVLASAIFSEKYIWIVGITIQFFQTK